MVSSLEDRQEVFKSAQGPGPLKKSLDSPSTSVWGTSTGKGPKSGQFLNKRVFLKSFTSTSLELDNIIFYYV